MRIIIATPAPVSDLIEDLADLAHVASDVPDDLDLGDHQAVVIEVASEADARALADHFGDAIWIPLAEAIAYEGDAADFPWRA